jgi:hypothetical protein
MNRPPRADFGLRIVKLPNLPDRVVLVIDNNTGGPSVTNDAEAVVAHIRLAMGPDQAHTRIFYRDSIRGWDEMLWARDIVTFAPGPEGIDFEQAWRDSEPYPQPGE